MNEPESSPWTRKISKRRDKVYSLKKASSLNKIIKKKIFFIYVYQIDSLFNVSYFKNMKWKKIHDQFFFFATIRKYVSENLIKSISLKLGFVYYKVTKTS